MAKKKKSTTQRLPAAGGANALKRHKKAASRKNDRWATAAPLPPASARRAAQEAALGPIQDGDIRRPAPALTSKHTTYFEFVENKEKKKKLEFEVTNKREPPPGFDFVPVGNPDLTKACKELSREQDAMIFIVATFHESSRTTIKFKSHMTRVGHHIRRTIVEQARASLGQPEEYFLSSAGDDKPEPIPESQEEYNAQVDAVIRDLFPRMPNTDRQTIIDHAFRKGGGDLVGLATDLTLCRRVQLAVLAHIRHEHTTYDTLWRLHGYLPARKAIEPVCLDFLVKWRGDEETGRDQLDEILREIIVISDSENSDDDSEDDDDSDDEEEDDSGEESSETEAAESPESNDPPTAGQAAPQPTLPDRMRYRMPPRNAVGYTPATHRRLNSTNKRRYEAAAQTRWQQAQERARHGPVAEPPSAGLVSAAPGRRVDYEHAHRDVRPAPDVQIRSFLPQDDRGQPGTLAREPPHSLTGSEPATGHRQGYPRVTLQGHAQQIPFFNPVDRGQPGSTPTRLPDLKDCLVPSIEPRSPDNTAVPVFVRSLPPRPQLKPPGLSHPRRSQSPMHRSPQPHAAHNVLREREPLVSRHVYAHEPRMDGLGALMQQSSLQGREPAQYGPGLGHQTNSAISRTERRPIVVEDWDSRRSEIRGGGAILRTEPRQILVDERGYPAERVAALTSGATYHPPQDFVRQEDGTVRVHGFNKIPVVDHDDPRALAYSERVENHRVDYYRPIRREYLPAPPPLRRQELVVRPLSPLFYQRQPGAANGSFAPQYDDGYRMAGVDMGGRPVVRNGPYAPQPPPGEYGLPAPPPRQIPPRHDQRQPPQPAPIEYIRID